MQPSSKRSLRTTLFLLALAAFASGCFWYGPRRHCYGCYRHADGYWRR